MTIGWQEQLRSKGYLREIVQQATAALISMDAERLQELAHCCADLNREMQQTCCAQQAAEELNAAAYDVQLLGRILYETRANLTVFSRLHVMRLQESGVLAGNPRPYGAEAIATFAQEFSKQEGKATHGDN